MKSVFTALLVLMSFVVLAQPRFVKERSDYNGEEVMLPFALHAQGDSGQSINATCRLSGRLDSGELEVFTVEHQNIVAYPYRELKGAMIAQGYLPSYFALFPMDLPKADYIAKMQPIQEGAVFVAEGIVFLGDNTNIYFSSADALQSLLAFMNMNPTTRIRITGHVNVTAETKLSDTQLMALAKKRAEGIQDYLISHGISKHRISIMGRGREAVKYPDPQSEAELEYNRRVEIEIIGF
jgi:outer membrane protein OmpA-like peptidoglycan-associated protein